MAHLNESPVWEEHILRLLITHSPVGGDGGITNTQPNQIANRTYWLLKVMSREHSLTGHVITPEQVAEGAGISEDKIAFDVSPDTITAAQAEDDDALEALEAQAREYIGKDGLRFEALLRAQRFLWETGMYGYGFEFFTDTLNMRKFYERIVTSTVHRDDTIQLETDVTGISVGDFMVVYSDANRGDAELITVKEILLDSTTGNYRILAKEKLVTDRNDGRIGSMSWDILDDGSARAVPGSKYVSDRITAVSTAFAGQLVINHAPDSNGRARLVPLTVKIMRNGSSEWEQLTPLRTETAAAGGYDVVYNVPGEAFYLYVGNDSDMTARIGYIAAVPVMGRRTVPPVRKPVVYVGLNTHNTEHWDIVREGGDATMDVMSVYSSTFRRCYGDNLAKTVFEFTKDGETSTWTVADGTEASAGIEDNEGNVTTMDAEFAEFMRGLGMGMVDIRCKHISDVGDHSEWSDPISVRLTMPVRYFGLVEGPVTGDVVNSRIGAFDLEEWRPKSDPLYAESEHSGKFYSLKDEQLARFAFAGTSEETKNTAGFDSGTFIKE